MSSAGYLEMVGEAIYIYIPVIADEIQIPIAVSGGANATLRPRIRICFVRSDLKHDRKLRKLVIPKIIGADDPTCQTEMIRVYNVFFFRESGNVFVKFKITNIEFFLRKWRVKFLLTHDS